MLLYDEPECDLCDDFFSFPIEFQYVSCFSSLSLIVLEFCIKNSFRSQSHSSTIHLSLPSLHLYDRIYKKKKGHKWLDIQHRNHNKYNLCTATINRQKTRVQALRFTYRFSFYSMDSLYDNVFLILMRRDFMRIYLTIK